MFGGDEGAGGKGGDDWVDGVGIGGEIEGGES